MAGRPKEDPTKTQQQEIADKKADFLAYYEALPIKKAGADFIGRTLDTINDWEAKDPHFADQVLKAKAEYARKHGKGRPDHLLPKLYPEFKPEKQEVSSTVTLIEQQSVADLIAEAKAQGLDTSAYEQLIHAPTHPGTNSQDRAEEGA